MAFLETTPMQFAYRHFTTIDSTNTWAKQNAHLFAHDRITLVTADAQTAGRGRFKRQWVSPAGQNIYATFCFFIEKHRKDIGNIPQVLALSAAKALEELGFKPELKWPNDVLLSKKKVAGILAETTPLSDQICMILGIGLNVNMPLDVLQGIDRPATSLSVESGKTFEIKAVLSVLKKVFQVDLEQFLVEGFHPFLEEYRKRIKASADTLIRFSDFRAIWEGKLSAINEDGSLRLQLADGTEKTFVTGEIL